MSVKTRRLMIMGVMCFLVLGLMSFVPTPVAAYHDAGKQTVKAGEWVYWTASDLGSGSSSWSVTYSVSVGSSDPNFNAYVMRSSEFTKYTNNQNFYYVIDCSVLSTHSVVSKSCTPNTAESYVLVLDNNDNTLNPYGYDITFTYTVDTTNSSSGTGNSDIFTAFGIMCILVIVIIVVIVIAIIVFMVRRRSQPQQPVYQQPVQQPYYQQPAPMYQPPPPPMDPYQQQYQQPPPPPYGGGPGYGSPPPPPYR